MSELREFHMNVKRSGFDRIFRLSIERDLPVNELMQNGLEMFLFLGHEELFGTKFLIRTPGGYERTLSVLKRWKKGEPSIHEPIAFCCNSREFPHRIVFKLPETVISRYLSSDVAPHYSLHKAIGVGVILYTYLCAEESEEATFYLRAKSGSTAQIYII